MILRFFNKIGVKKDVKYLQNKSMHRLTTDINQIQNMNLKSNIVDVYNSYNNGDNSCFLSKLVEFDV